MALPSELYEILEGRLGTSIRHATAIGGGMVNKAAKVVTVDGPVFVKWKPDAAPGMFESEAEGLERLRAAGALRVPEIVAVGDVADDPSVELPYLALEWIQPEEPVRPRRFAENFAAGLAEMHRNSASPSGAFGLERDNFLGRRVQSNAWTADWPAFYRDHRLLPMVALAQSKGRLNPERERMLHKVIDNADRWLGSGEPACLVHGDLWSGNFLTVRDAAALVDPAIYYADREVEIAYIQLFGGFPPGFVDLYALHYPLDAGYLERRPLLQLYPLLVHLISFGEGYGPQVDAVCRRYLE